MQARVDPETKTVRLALNHLERKSLRRSIEIIDEALVFPVPPMHRSAAEVARAALDELLKWFPATKKAAEKEGVAK